MRGLQRRLHKQAFFLYVEDVDVLVQLSCNRASVAQRAIFGAAVVGRGRGEGEGIERVDYDLAVWLLPHGRGHGVVLPNHLTESSPRNRTKEKVPVLNTPSQSPRR